MRRSEGKSSGLGNLVATSAANAFGGALTSYPMPRANVALVFGEYCDRIMERVG
jgi:hypothetical protein